MEHLISLAENWGYRIFAKSKSCGVLNAVEKIGEKDKKASFRALQKTVDDICIDPKTYAALLLRDSPNDLRGGFSVDDFNLKRLTCIYPDPYAEKEFQCAAE